MRALAKSIWALILTLPLSLPLPLAAQEQASFSQAELDQMLAPIALYPDTLLSHILIAATYPLEVVQAARWSRDNPGLEGEAAVAAVEEIDWDPSVKALVAFPQVLARMDEDLEWTQRLGEAFLAQESQMADSIQALRARAYDAGNLDSLEHVHVQREPGSIIIEPASHHIVYVPYYDTRVIYGGWWWPAYPPVYWAYPHGYPAFYYGTTWFSWGHGIHVSPFFFFSSFHWPHRHVVVHHHHHRHQFHSGRDVARHHDARKWRHDPRHRRNVAYHDGRRDHDRRRTDDRVHARNHWQPRAAGRDTPRQPAVERREQRRPVMAVTRPERPARTSASPRTETRQRDGQRLPGLRQLPAQPQPANRGIRARTTNPVVGSRTLPGRIAGPGTRHSDVRRERSTRRADGSHVDTRRADAERSRASRSVPAARHTGEPRAVGSSESKASRNFSRGKPAGTGRDIRSGGRGIRAASTRGSKQGGRGQGSWGRGGRFSDR